MAMQQTSDRVLGAVAIGLLAGALVLAACGGSVEPAAVAIDDGRITVEPETIRAPRGIGSLEPGFALKTRQPNVKRFECSVI